MVNNKTKGKTNILIVKIIIKAINNLINNLIFLIILMIYSTSHISHKIRIHNNHNHKIHKIANKIKIIIVNKTANKIIKRMRINILDHLFHVLVQKNRNRIKKKWKKKSQVWANLQIQIKVYIGNKKAMKNSKKKIINRL